MRCALILDLFYGDANRDGLSDFGIDPCWQGWSCCLEYSRIG